MKKWVQPIVFLLLICLGSFSLGKAQCIANAGNDTVLCLVHNSVENFQLNASISGGTPPYTYSWSCDVYYQILNFTFHSTASDYLNDTTLANPTFISAEDTTVVFHVTVTDSLGNTCQDSVSVLFNIWSFHLGILERYISAGDTVQLDGHYSSYIPPATYSWSPTTGLSDPTDINTLAFPDTTTVYTLATTDSMGCQGQTTFTVYVNSVNVGDETERYKVNIYPIPLAETSIIELLGYENSELTVFIYDLTGCLVKTIPVNSQRTQLKSSDFKSGVYIYSIVDDGCQIEKGKLVVR